MPPIGVIVRVTLGDRANSMSKRSDSSFDFGERKGIFQITVGGMSGIPEATLSIQQSAMKKRRKGESGEMVGFCSLAATPQTHLR